MDLENENNKRKEITVQHENQAVQMINSNIDIEQTKVIVLYSKDWHFGIVGIVASRIKELYNRPTIIMSEENGIYKGSCRSIADYDIVEALNQCSDLLDNFGGHPMAAGLSIKEENITAFNKAINEHAINTITKSLTPSILIDYELNLSEINNRFLNFLNYLEPFGPGNPKPVFVTKNLEGINDVRLLGKDRETLKFKVYNNDLELDVIGFRMLEHYEKLLSGKKIDIVYTIDKNHCNVQVATHLLLKVIIYSE